MLLARSFLLLSMVGLFDSGIGGLTVVRELLRQAPDVSFVYLGDTARYPYGNKSPDTIARYARENVEFLLAQGATSIVIACNTASAYAASALCKAYPTIPIFEVITPAVDEALRVTRRRVGVIGTRGTVASGAYQKALGAGRQDIEVVARACPLFVPLVEEGWLDCAETKRIIKHYLSPLRQAGVDALILGCTHYPLLKPLIARYMGSRVNLIDSGEAVVATLLSSSVISHGREQRFFLTDPSSRAEEVAGQWLGRRIVIRGTNNVP